MASTSPLIQGNTLNYQQDGQPAQLTVDTSDWYIWLSSASTFTYRSEHGTFTARKERAGSRRGGEYWKAYCRRHGKLYRAYLGKSEELTLQRLQSIAVVLAGKGERGDPLDVHDLIGGTRQPSVNASVAGTRLLCATGPRQRSRARHSYHCPCTRTVGGG